MDTNQTNKLPEGVGKKIVEALRLQQSEISEVQQAQDFNFENDINTMEDTFAEEEITFEQVLEEENWDFEDKDFDEEQEEVKFASVQSAVFEDVQPEFTSPQPPIQHSQPVMFEVEQPKIQQPQPVQAAPSFADLNIDLPQNIAVLKRLISQLPAGVTRQTGAQIIRQTMEAMGISMTKVLSEAQAVQENLTGSVNDKMNTIEEYKNNIRKLEIEAQECKKQAAQLGDLINLFILSEK